MKKLSVVFVDVIGLKYHGDTLSERGLGGSESAVICMARELAELGLDVKIFNNCEKEGVYNSVQYLDLSRLDTEYHTCDVFVGSRTCVPFYEARYEQLRKSAKLKILWMHDTFCGDDPIVEDLVVNGSIDEIFTLSDFHTAYISNCWHGGNRRNFEVLKNKIWMTRNGINLHIPEVDVKAKDPDLFVYNASVSKGMKPLLNSIWQQIKTAIPNARLTIIGGYYKWDITREDIYEVEVKELYDQHHGKNGVTFTGIIPQHEIAKHLAKASLFLYPGAFPETFGISTLESLAYNTPLVTTRFGALEETAVNEACYLIDYAIEPNNLFPNINQEHQIEKFVAAVMLAHSNKYLLQQKQNYCSIVKDVATWDTVAIQWKQHLYRKLGLYLSAAETRHADKINHRVHEVFGRRFMNKEEMVPIRARNEQFVNIVTPCYNAEQYIEKCIQSVASQDYDSWHHIIINDCSTDKTYDAIWKAIRGLPENLREKFTVISNKKNVGAVHNQYEAFKICRNGIVMLLDGDDWLINDPHIFTKYNRMYEEETVEFTYGSCWSIADNIPLIAQDYPNDVKQAKAYRNHHFNWILPYTHLRTFSVDLIEKLDANKLLDENGDVYRAGGDGAMFYALIECADPNKVKAVKDIVYMYNDASPINDYKVNGEEQNRNAKRIVEMNDAPRTKRILIAIPTAKYIEAETFKTIYDLEVPEGYETYFQFFYGYNIDQIRNLIGSWIVNGGYDYLFSVDSDMSFAPDTLKRLLAHDKGIACGVYRQRKEELILELYGPNGNLLWDQIGDQGLVPVDACGFGCTLVHRSVFEAVGYPWFQYHSSLEYQQTISEDVDFCRKASAKGFVTFADTTIRCKHHGSTTFVLPEPKADTQRFFNDLRHRISIPAAHKQHLEKMKVAMGFVPKVVYDIGACVLHWTDAAKTVWPTAKYFAFEAMQECEPLYKKEGIPYAIGVFGNEDGKEVTFYENVYAPGGNSMYMENPQYSPKAIEYYGAPQFQKKRLMRCIDTVVNEKNFPLPDLIKIDVQGAEFDILLGLGDILDHARYLILELPNVEYNIGAPEALDVVEWLKGMGWAVADEKFCNNGADADWLFYNTKLK